MKNKEIIERLEAMTKRFGGFLLVEENQALSQAIKALQENKKLKEKLQQSEAKYRGALQSIANDELAEENKELKEEIKRLKG